MYDLEGLSIAELEELKKIIGNNNNQEAIKNNSGFNNDDIYSYLQSYTDEIENEQKSF